jgi:endonuclease YncB( thermonuclease family)
MLRVALLFLTLPLSAYHQPDPPMQRNPVFSGKVVRVVSGDTVKVVIIAKDFPAADGKEVGLRLWGADAPKLNEPFGADAKRRMTTLALGRVVIVEDWGRDEVGNCIGEVYLELPSKWEQRSYFTVIRGQSGPHQQVILNDEMVASGLARPSKPSGIRDYDFIEQRLQKALEAAQKAKRGIWGK